MSFTIFAEQPQPRFYGNPSHSYCPCSNAVEAGIDILFLQPFEEGLAYAIRNDARQGVGGADGTPGGPVIDLEPRWQPGMRLALGYAPSFTARLVWTLFHASTTNHAHSNTSLPGSGLQSIWFPAIDTSILYASAAFRWKLDFDTLDFELGKRYDVSKYLSFNPVCMLRLARISQSFKARYGDSDNALASNDFHAAGPGFAIRSEWGFSRGWAICCASGFSLFYGRFKTSYALSSQNIPLQTLIGGVKQRFERMTPAVDFSAGLGYGKCLSKGRWRIAAALSYEAHYYWDQNQLRAPIGSDAPALALLQPRDLSIQGFSLRASCEF